MLSALYVFDIDLPIAIPNVPNIVKAPKNGHKNAHIIFGVKVFRQITTFVFRLIILFANSRDYYSLNLHA